MTHDRRVGLGFLLIEDLWDPCLAYTQTLLQRWQSLAHTLKAPDGRYRVKFRPFRVHSSTPVVLTSWPHGWVSFELLWNPIIIATSLSIKIQSTHP